MVPKRTKIHLALSGGRPVRYDKVGDAVTVIDTVSGQIRAKIAKTAPGNAEKLAP